MTCSPISKDILTLRWTDVDLYLGILRLADSKTGAKVIYLGAPALEVLASLPRLPGNPYVLPQATSLACISWVFRRFGSAFGLLQDCQTFGCTTFGTRLLLSARRAGTASTSSAPCWGTRTRRQRSVMRIFRLIR